MSVSVQFTSQDKAKFRKDLKEYARRFDRTIKEALDEVALEVTNEAKERVPVLTGRLRSSIRPEFLGSPRPFRRVGTNVGYGLFVEFGTIRQRAQPFLRPALEIGKRNIFKGLRKEYNNAKR